MLQISANNPRLVSFAKFFFPVHFTFHSSSSHLVSRILDNWTSTPKAPSVLYFELDPALQSTLFSRAYHFRQLFASRLHLPCGFHVRGNLGNIFTMCGQCNSTCFALLSNPSSRRHSEHKSVRWWFSLCNIYSECVSDIHWWIFCTMHVSHP